MCLPNLLQRQCSTCCGLVIAAELQVKVDAWNPVSNIVETLGGGKYDNRETKEGT